MRIYNFSRVLAFPFGMVFGYLLYKSFTDLYFDNDIYMIPLGLVLVIIYVFSPQIDYWWQKKFPVHLDKEVRSLIKEYNPFYNALSEEKRLKYEQRMSLFMHNKDFSAMGEEKRSVPYDLKALVSQIPIHMTFNKDDYMFGDFDRIIFYKHPFPSPRYQFLHAMETELEDGVIILSLQHFEAAVRSPKQYYNIAYHAFAEAYIKLNPSVKWPDISGISWSDLEQISKFPKSSLLKAVGFGDLDPLVVMICYYFVFPRAFMEHQVALKKEFDRIFFNN